MNVEIGAQAALFPEKEYINGIFVAVNTKYVQICTVEKGLKNSRDHICSSYLEIEICCST
jgi:hypothetical protein